MLNAVRVYMEILIKRKICVKLRNPFLRCGFWIPIQNVKMPASINKLNSCIIVTGNGRSKIQSNNNLATCSTVFKIERYLHPQNVRLQNVRLQNVRLQNVRFQNVRFQNVWNVRFTKRLVYKMLGLQNVRFTKRQVYKTSSLQNVNLTFCKPDVLKPDVLNPDVLKPDVLKPDVLWVYR